MKLKRVFSLITSIILIFMTAHSVLAKDDSVYVGMFPFAKEGAFDGLNNAQINEIKARAKKASNEFQDKFNIYDLGIDEKYANSVYNVIYLTHAEHAEYFYMDSRLNCNLLDKKVNDVFLYYLYDKAETITKMTGIVNEVVDIMVMMYKSGVKTDFDKALWLHDYIITNAEYDGTLNKHGLDNLMLEKTAVCQGYTGTYNYLLKLVGIESACVFNNTDKHMWSRVKLDGSWYNVDMTFDDPSFDFIHDRLGFVSHKYFLLTDEEIGAFAKHGEKYSSVNNACTDTRYKNAAFKNAETAVAFIGNNRYFVTSGSDVVKCDRSMNITNPVYYHIDTQWFTRDSRESYYDNYYGGLGEYNGALYYNTGDALMRLDVSGEKPSVSTVFQYKPLSSYFPSGVYLFGSYVRNGVMYYAEANYMEITDDSGNKTVDFFGTANDKMMSFNLHD